MRLVSTATCTSGDPVSPSVVAYSSMIFFLAAVSSDTALLLYRVRGIKSKHPKTMRTHSHPGGRAITPCAGSRLLPVTSQRQITVPRPTWNPVNDSNTLSWPSVPGSPAGQLTGRLDVLPHPLDQLLDRVELERVAQPGGEVDADVRAVQVEVVAVEGVRLDGALPALEGRVDADGDRGRPARVRVDSRAVPLEFGVTGTVEVAGVHPVERDGGVRQALLVGCGESEVATALRSSHVDALDAVGPSEQARCGLDVALGEALAD